MEVVRPLNTKYEALQTPPFIDTPLKMARISN